MRNELGDIRRSQVITSSEKLSPLLKGELLVPGQAGYGTGTILTGGTMALSDAGGATNRCEDWIHMYRPSTRESYLLESLGEHTKELPL